MRKMKSRQDGYVLGWVIIMVMVLTVLVTAVLFAASAYYRLNLREYDRRQAYLTARSAVQLAAEDFTGGGSGELRDAIMEELDEELTFENGVSGDGEHDSSPVPISDIEFQLDSSMGSCTMYGFYLPDEDCLILTASAKKNRSRELMTVRLQWNRETEEEPWTVLGYEKGGEG